MTQRLVETCFWTKAENLDLAKGVVVSLRPPTFETATPAQRNKSSRGRRKENTKRGMREPPHLRTRTRTRIGTNRSHKKCRKQDCNKVNVFFC